MNTITPITNADEIRTRTIWAILTEPNDPIANTLINTYGRTQALHHALNPDFTSPDPTTQERLTTYRRHTPTTNDPLSYLTEAADQATARATACGAVMIDPTTIPGLTDLADNTPLTLWARGDLTALTNQPAIAITGARASTGYGEHHTANYATHLTRHGATIHSGLGYGTDGAAHRAALGAGGSTIAWLPSGIDRPYPAGHTNLYNMIATTARCAIITENLPGTTPNRTRFLARQRLLAAATQITLITEAGRNSASLTAATHAHTLHRHIAAIPGPIDSPTTHGPHHLIQKNIATLTTHPTDLHPHLNIP